MERLLGETHIGKLLFNKEENDRFLKKNNNFFFVIILTIKHKKSTICSAFFMF